MAAGSCGSSCRCCLHVPTPTQAQPPLHPVKCAVSLLAPLRVPLHVLHICRVTEDVGWIVLPGGGWRGGRLWSQLVVFRDLPLLWFWCCVWVEATFLCTVVVLTAFLNTPPPFQRRGAGSMCHGVRLQYESPPVQVHVCLFPSSSAPVQVRMSDPRRSLPG